MINIRSLNAEIFLMQINVASLVKFGLVLAEIFLKWTNVALTNVTTTVGICSRCSQEPSLRVSSKLGQ